MLYDDGRFEWETEKDEINRKKHGVSFEVAKLAFDDFNNVLDTDRIDDETGERRWHLIGEATKSFSLSCTP